VSTVRLMRGAHIAGRASAPPPIGRAAVAMQRAPTANLAAGPWVEQVGTLPEGQLLVAIDRVSLCSLARTRLPELRHESC
jgi:hypothetical protein